MVTVEAVDGFDMCRDTVFEVKGERNYAKEKADTSTETKKQSPNTGARANNTLHT